MAKNAIELELPKGLETASIIFCEESKTIIIQLKDK
jgi:hypothetical protein